MLLLLLLLFLDFLYFLCGPMLFMGDGVVAE
jgi:hypothetical protein